jgi:hypothetical protein
VHLCHTTHRATYIFIYPHSPRTRNSRPTLRGWTATTDSRQSTGKLQALHLRAPAQCMRSSGRWARLLSGSCISAACRTLTLTLGAGVQVAVFQIGINYTKCYAVPSTLFTLFSSGQSAMHGFCSSPIYTPTRVGTARTTCASSVGMSLRLMS